MLVARSDKEILFFRDGKGQRWLPQLVAGEFLLIEPVPHKEAFVLRVSKRDEKVVLRGEPQTLDADFVSPQVLNFRVADHLTFVFATFGTFSFYR